MTSRGTRPPSPVDVLRPYPATRRRRGWPRARYVCERLESRRLLSATGPTLYLSGTPGSDDIIFSAGAFKDPANNFALTYTFFIQGQLYYSDQWGDIVFSTLGGNDRVTDNGLLNHALTLNFGNGNDQAIVNYGAYGSLGTSSDTPITLHGGGGFDTLTFNGQRDYNPDNHASYNVYWVDGSSITEGGYNASGNNFFGGDTITYSGMSRLDLFTTAASPRNTTVNILGSLATALNVTAANTDTTFNVSLGTNAPISLTGGGGNDTFNVSAYIGAQMTLNGGAGNNALYVQGANGGLALVVRGNTVGVGGQSIVTANVGEIHVLSGSPNETIYVASTYVPTFVATTGGLGAVIIGVDPAGLGGHTLGTIQSPLMISSAVVTIDNSLDNAPHTQTITAAAFGGVAPAPIGFAALTALTVLGGRGGNTFSLSGAGENFPVTLDTGTGSNLVQVNALAQANLTLVDQGTSDVLLVNDTALTTGVTYVLTTGAIARGLMSVQYNALTILDVFGTAGDDTFDFGNGTIPHNLAVTINLDGGSGTNNHVAVDNHLSTGYNEGYDVTASSLDESWKFGPLGSFNYSHINSLSVEATSGNNNFTITGTAPGVSIGINGNDGNDAFYVIPTDGAAHWTVLGTLFLTGANGNDAVVIDSSADPNGIGYALDTGVVSVFGGGTVYYSTESLTINTGAGPDYFNVDGAGVTTTLNTGAGDDTVNVAPAGENLDTIPAALNVNAGGGAEMTVFDQANPNFVFTQDTISPASLTRFAQTLYVGQVAFHTATINYAGLARLTLDTGNLVNVVNVEGTSAPTTVNPGSANVGINVDETSPGNAVTIGPGTSQEPVTVNNDGAGVAEARFAGTQRIGALTIAAGGTATVAPGGGTLLIVPSLAMTGSARLDLTDEGMIVDYTGTSPVAGVTAALASGYASGSWNGAGIASSTAAARSGRAVGFAESSALLKITGAQVGTFMGQIVDATSLLLRYTLAGDATLDGKVDFGDLVRLAQNYNTTGGQTWTAGDSNYDGKVNFADLVALAQNYNTAVSALPLVAGAASLASALPAKLGSVFAPRPLTVPTSRKPSPKPVSKSTSGARPATRGTPFARSKRVGVKELLA